ncbi:hypothetical protein [Rhizobium sp.]
MAFENDHILFAEFGKVVSQARAGYASADNDYLMDPVGCFSGADRGIVDHLSALLRAEI